MGARPAREASGALARPTQPPLPPVRLCLKPRWVAKPALGPIALDDVGSGWAAVQLPTPSQGKPCPWVALLKGRASASPRGGGGGVTPLSEGPGGKPGPAALAAGPQPGAGPSWVPGRRVPRLCPPSAPAPSQARDRGPPPAEAPPVAEGFTIKGASSLGP